MRVPLEWLKEYVAVRLAPQALAERLTMAGLEVVGIQESEGGAVFDIEVTPNRADCLSILGVAREVAVITGQRLRLPSAQGSGVRAQGKRSRPGARSPEPRARIEIVVEDRASCLRYIGRLIEGITVGPSPEWMQRRLIACGARPINNVVDITNYVLLERGQPLHAFDVDRLSEGTIIVRRARPQEPITTLDGVRRALTAEMLVIADAAQAVAVAGIMGGMGSEVTARTTRVVLESALFDPVRIRRTGRALGLASESSYRFERGVDPAGVEAASNRAASLLAELAGGSLVDARDLGARPAARQAIALEPARVSRWLGMPVGGAAIRSTLARLSCRVMSSGERSPLRVIPPSFRQDLTREVDLYEELARSIGYDRIPSTLPHAPLAMPAAGRATPFGRAQALRRACVGLGLTEAITWSLVSEADLARCGFKASEAVRLANPLSQDHAYLRPSLLIGLLRALARNATQGADGAALFEMGTVSAPGEAASALRLGIVLFGDWLRDWRTHERSDFFRIKGLVDALAGRSAGRRTVRLTAAPHAWLEPAQSTTVQLDGQAVGALGQVSKRILQALDVEQDAWFAELAAEPLLASSSSASSLHAPPSFPPVKRDLSVIVEARTPYEPIIQTIREIGGPLADRVRLIDRYVGGSIPPGMYSLTCSIEYRDPARTLTAEEADTLHQRIRAELATRFHATLR